MKENSRHIIPYELFIKHLNDELNEDEEITLKAWLKADADHPGILDEYKRTWDLMGHIDDVSTVNLEKEWAKQKNAIYLKEGSELEVVKKSGSSFHWNITGVAAAAAFILVASFAIFLALSHFSNERIVTEQSIRSLTLPDGTQVTLNKKSRIRYPSSFRADSREVSIEGEGYFEVVKNPQAPFIIKTERAIIEVVGTSFNVRAYEFEKMVEVAVSEGVVSLSPKKDPENKVILGEGKTGIYDHRDRSLNKMDIPDMNYLSWKTGKIVFDEDHLKNVIETLSRIYERKIILKDSSLGNCMLTATFEDQSLESVMNVISSTLSLNLTIEGNTFILSGNGC